MVKIGEHEYDVEVRKSVHVWLPEGAARALLEALDNAGYHRTLGDRDDKHERELVALASTLDAALVALRNTP